MRTKRKVAKTVRVSVYINKSVYTYLILTGNFSAGNSAAGKFAAGNFAAGNFFPHGNFVA